LLMTQEFLTLPIKKSNNSKKLRNLLRSPLKPKRRKLNKRREKKKLELRWKKKRTQKKRKH